MIISIFTDGCKNMVKEFIVIGAGLSGLNVARKIREHALGDVLILEKSRGVGGRMATRRTMGTRFDHGAQFYRLKPEISEPHQKWQHSGIGHRWFESEKGEHWCSSSGMTAFAKDMAVDLDISLEKEIKSVRREGKAWTLTSNKGETWSCRNLIISSPTPQTLKLLEEINHEQMLDEKVWSKLKSITYTKALIALVVLDEGSELDMELRDYLEFETGHFFSISNQQGKGVSSTSALSITMSPQFSDDEFEHDDESTLQKILKCFMAAYPNVKIKSAELKKWRYCQPTNHPEKLFEVIAPQLYLIGDSFGGSSLLGAIRSSEALWRFLSENRS